MKVKKVFKKCILLVTTTDYYFIILLLLFHILLYIFIPWGIGARKLLFSPSNTPLN